MQNFGREMVICLSMKLIVTEANLMSLLDDALASEANLRIMEAGSGDLLPEIFSPSWLLLTVCPT